jgi:lipopolysaccharide biosynthesis glycosyltransferase
MKKSIHVAFAADRRVLPGLHVAAYSMLENHRDQGTRVHLHLFSNDITSADLALLKTSLEGTCRDYEMSFHSVDEKKFTDSPSMGGSWGAYFRIMMPGLIDADRIVYLDVDTLCRMDVAEFLYLDLGGHPAGFVIETTFASTPDLSLKSLFQDAGENPCFNSGVMVVDRKKWMEKRVTERCLEFMAHHHAQYFDQTTLNYVLFKDWQALESRFNFYSNSRINWPFLKDDKSAEGKIIHFLDNPKPWDFGAEKVHPHYHLWRFVLDKTAMRGYRSWKFSAGRDLPRTSKALQGYKKAIKDRILFSLYSGGILKKIKGL